MNQEQIEKLAQEYVDKNYNGDLDFPSYDAIVNVISFMAERYAIVDKSKIKEMWESITNVYLAHSHITYDGARYIFDELLGEGIIQELFKDKKE